MLARVRSSSEIRWSSLLHPEAQVSWKKVGVREKLYLWWNIMQIGRNYNSWEMLGSLLHLCPELKLTESLCALSEAALSKFFIEFCCKQQKLQYEFYSFQHCSLSAPPSVLLRKYLLTFIIREPPEIALVWGWEFVNFVQADKQRGARDNSKIYQVIPQWLYPSRSSRLCLCVFLTMCNKFASIFRAILRLVILRLDSSPRLT